MTSYLMDPFHDCLVSTTHVSAKHAPYYSGWVRQAYEIVGEKLTVPLSRDDEQERHYHPRKDSPVHRHHLRLTYPPEGVGFTGTFVGSVGYSHSMVAGGLLVMS